MLISSQMQLPNLITRDLQTVQPKGMINRWSTPRSMLHTRLDIVWPFASRYLSVLFIPGLTFYHLSSSQRFICPKCRLGVTRIQDLSHADMKKVRQLALIDMTAVCDLLELEVKRHKTSKRKMPGTTANLPSSFTCWGFTFRLIFPP